MRRLPLRSPPRVRGKVCHTMAEAKGLGITPAYAGKSRCNLPSTAPWKDHPRVCGEKPPLEETGNPVQGSPPRMRGKAILRSSPAQLVGITPAYAGKRSACSPPSPHSRDHPRVCGEKWNKLHFGEDCQGSPPRVRGKGANITISGCAKGITPACAGKSRAVYFCVVAWWDHPRVCGEKLKSFANAVELEGSPPRVRGKVNNGTSRNYGCRITPACAGKSCLVMNVYR